MTVEEILAALRAIVDGATGRDLTDEEAGQYEELEGKLANARRTQEIQKRQAAYNSVTIPSDLAAAVHVGTQKQDDTLDRAFNHYLRTGKENQDLVELRAQSVGTDAAGGYMVPSGFRQKLVDVQKAYGGLASVVDEFTTGDGTSVEFPSIDDTANTGQITNEGSAVSGGADLTFGTVTLGAFKYTASGASNAPVKVSVELLQDSAFDVEALLAQKLGERIARKQATDWVVGSGSGQPSGIAKSSLSADITLATGNAVTYQKLLDLQDALDLAYEPNSRWTFSKAMWSKIRGVVDGQSRPLIYEQATSGMGTAPERMLLGYPVTLDNAWLSPPTTGVFVAAYGDLREAYVIRRVADVTVLVNPYSSAASGQVEFHAWARADGNIQNRSAYKLLKTANS